MHLSLWYIVFVCHQNDVCENYIGSVHVGGYCGLSVICKLCPVGFLVFCKAVCCSLLSCRMLIMMMGRWSVDRRS